MRKAFDFILIGLLAVNLYRTYVDYSPETDVMGASIPTWVAVLIQVLCIVFLGFKIWKDYAASKQV